VAIHKLFLKYIRKIKGTKIAKTVVLKNLYYMYRRLTRKPCRVKCKTTVFTTTGTGTIEHHIKQNVS
jgi:hypothetical protein